MSKAIKQFYIGISKDSSVFKMEGEFW